MVGPRLALGVLVVTALAGCEPQPSVAPSVLEAAEAKAAALEAELSKSEEARAREAERVEALLKEVRAARELISGRESEAIERRHYEVTLLRSASAEVDQLLLGTKLLETLRASRRPQAARALEALEATPARPFTNLAALHEAQGALLSAIPALLQGAEAGGQDRAAARARHLSEIEELRTQLARQEEDTLRLARDHELTLRKLMRAREVLREIASGSEPASKARAERGLEASQPGK